MIVKVKTLKITVMLSVLFANSVFLAIATKRTGDEEDDDKEIE